MTPDILIAIILFTLTLLVYCLLMPAIRIRRGKYGPWPIRVLVVSILVNCLCQVYLLLHGHITCTLVFISLNAIEALVIGLITESAVSMSGVIYERFCSKYNNKYNKNEPLFIQYIDMQNIVNSMQLDSGLTIAKLENKRYCVSLEVNGDVRVLWTPDPNGTPTQAYAWPSKFPPELAEVFAKDMYTYGMENIQIEDSNWFEIFIEDKKEHNIIDSIVVGPEQMTPAEVKMLLQSTWNEYCNEEKSES